MARPLSEDKRNAILNAASDSIAELGVSAPTAKIAKAAGVAEGTLFTYFANKDDLLNQLYLELKHQLNVTMMAAYPSAAELRRRGFHVWSRYIDWGAGFPAKRKALRQLTVSDRITEQSRQIGSRAFSEVEALHNQSLAHGALRGQSMAFAGAIMESLADTTLEFIAREPRLLESYKRAGFDAFWNAITAPQGLFFE